MLKLTSNDGHTLYAVAKHIEWMIQWPNYTELRVGGQSHFIDEKADHILEMPEMKAEIDKALLAAYPPMTVSGNLEDYPMLYAKGPR